MDSTSANGTDLLVQALQALAGRCDGAASTDTVGFNGADTSFGRDLAAKSTQYPLSPKQRAAAYKLLAKYSRQLRAAGIDYSEIPVPVVPATPERPAALAPVGIVAKFPGICTVCRRWFPAGTLVTFVGKQRQHATCPGPVPQPQSAATPVVAREEPAYGEIIWAHGPRFPYLAQLRRGAFVFDSHDCYETVAEAKAALEAEYPGLAGNWVDVPENDDFEQVIARALLVLPTAPAPTPGPQFPAAASTTPTTLPTPTTVGLTPAPSAPRTLSASPDSRAVAVLGPGGAIAQALPGYEPRAQQVELAAAIEAALESGGHHVSEAPTGVGKSLAYLVPASATTKRVLVSTSGKALQGQLVGKDLPFLAEIVPGLTYAQLKGRSNYACQLRLRQIEAEGQQLALDGEPQPTFKSREAAEAWAPVGAWLATTADGDLDLAPVPVPLSLRLELTVDSDSCLGQKCPCYGGCYAEQAKRRAAAARVIVVNHALLLRELELRHATGGHVSIFGRSADPNGGTNADGTPATVALELDAVILDEAHTLEDVATDAFETVVTRGRFTRLEHGIARLTTEHRTVRLGGATGARAAKSGDWQLKLGTAGSHLEALLGNLQERLTEAETTAQRLGDEAEGLPVAALLSELAEDLATGTPDWLTDGVEREQWAKLAQQCSKLAGDLLQLLTPNQPELVRYAEIANERLELHAKPIEVAQRLRERLWDAFPSVIATSATLAVQGNLTQWRRRVGCDHATETIVSSPFNYRQNALLYLPANGGAFDPTQVKDGAGSIAYFDRLASEIAELLLASDGRAFVLFSSNKALKAVYERLAPRLRSWLVLRQGELPVPELVKRFKGDGRAILFGTKSFWEGVDVQGTALSLVIVDRLPFTPPNDPVFEARVARVKERARAAGKSNWQYAWFDELALPDATRQVKQAVGRLIRTATDTGVMALLDGRLSTKRYGEDLLNDLPPAKRVRSLEAVRSFF